MRWLLFLSRLAFICGFAFLLSFLGLFFKWIENQELFYTVVVIGHVIGMVVVPVSLICYFVLRISGKKPNLIVPNWLILSNLLFLLLLFIYIFILNGSLNIKG